MKRQLLLCAAFGLVLVPDWVSACWPPAAVVRPPVYHYPAYAPVYYAPPVYYCQPVYLPPCPPVMHAPRVEHAKPRPSSALEAPKALAQPAPAPGRPPQVEPVRPVVNVEVPKPKDAGPGAVRPAAPEVPKITPPEAKGPKIEFPLVPEPKGPGAEKLPGLTLPPEATGPKPPAFELPKVDAPKLPALELPKEGELKLPGLELPKTDAPKLPEVPGAPAVPVPAPAPDALIPPLGLSVPGGGLPPLALPPDVPVTPEPKPVEAKSSPLTGAGPRVNVFPAAGPGAAGGLRKVGFYNHTAREVQLTIEGKEVKLPARSYLHAQLPATFTWRHADRPAAKETVPADAAGLDVVFRE